MTLRGGRAVRAFRHHNYRVFFGGQLISLVGTWMQQVAQAWLVLLITGDPFWLGVVTAAQFVPVLVFGLFAGVLADVLPKRWTLVGAQVVMMVLAGLLAILTATGLVEVWMIVALALALGVANAVDMPVRQAFVMELVGREDVANAVVLNSAMFNGARVVGPAVAGLTIGALGPAAAFTLNAVSYIAVIAGLVAMRPAELLSPPLALRPRSAGEMVGQLREGISYVRHTPQVLLGIAMVGLVATFAMNFNVIIPVLARDVLQTDASGYGFLMTASGIGSLIGAVWLAAAPGTPRPVGILAGAGLLGAAELALAFSGLFPVSMLLMLLVGTGGIVMAAITNTTIQLSVPDALRGRVMSVYTTVFAGSAPFGGLLIGTLASIAGIAAAVALGGVLSLVTVALAWIWLRRQPASVRGPVQVRRPEPTTRSAPNEPPGLPEGVGASTVRPR